MKMVQLSSYNGAYHLPLATGKFAVGATDIMTSNSLMRCFYPCSDDRQMTLTKSSMWMKWFPSVEYADGYLRFRFSKSIPFTSKLFTWITHDPFCPIIKDEPVIEGTEKLPVIIFSHGMGACRSTYSILLTEMASHGYFVAAIEHRDGSAACTTVVDAATGERRFEYDRKLTPEEKENEYVVRNSQVNVRVKECYEALKILEALSDNSFKADEWVEKPAESFLASIHSRLATDRPIISGHSFGGVTAVKALLTKSDVTKTRFNSGVMFDSWLYPIRDEAEQLVAQWNEEHTEPAKMIFVNCEKFQSVNNLRTMRHFEHTVKGSSLSTNVYTLRNTIHHAPSDVPTIFMGSWARYVFSFLLKKDQDEFPATDALHLCQSMFLAYMRHQGQALPIEGKEEEASFEKCVRISDNHLIYGTIYKEPAESETAST